jgi:DNA (cytosine-5)-methyltransferase 1
MPIPIIDLFAGPGGLGEGFSSVHGTDGKSVFKIRLSIEMDAEAHRTLQLRAFYRQFPFKEAPEAYYEYLRGDVTREALFERFPVEANAASHEAWQATLGETNPDEVSSRIAAALGANKDTWLLIGGPPCQAYSLVGRSRMIGEKGRSEFEKDHRHFLYREYLRIIAQHQPAVFVMENVKGLLSAKLDGQSMFTRILQDLKNPLEALPELASKSRRKTLNYQLYSVVVPRDLAGLNEPSDFIVRAEDYGIPQARHRIIILGIRDGFTSPPEVLKRATYVATVRDVIADLPKLRSTVSKQKNPKTAWHDSVRELTTSKWLNNGIDPDLRQALLDACDRVKETLGCGGQFVRCKPEPARHSQWYVDSRLGGICNHETRSHILADLHRYFYSAVYAKQFKTSPLLEHLPKDLLPLHKNVEEALVSNRFNDRFRVQVADRPSTTVVSHICKDGHYYIHYDPTQCRSLTVREAARLQTFPDNYFFEGGRTGQYHQVGNAVPPLLAKKIAELVRGLFS